METVNFNTRLVDGYMGLLKNLDPDNKLDLISKLSESLKSTPHQNSPALHELFGAYQSEQPAEELIDQGKAITGVYPQK